jgi:hypothetical protein
MKQIIQTAIRRAGYELSRRRAEHYDTDGLRTSHGHHFENDPAFMAAYEYAFNAASKDPSHHGTWRVHVAACAAKTALRRGGDFVECGTARAFVSTAIMKYTDWNDSSGGRPFYLVDTYEGIVEHLQTDEERATGAIPRHGTRYVDNYPDALRNVSPFSNVHLIKGTVPHILAEIPSKLVAYLHLDMNSAVAEVAAFEYFWPLMVNGGIILFDDYCYGGYEPQYHALADLAKRLGVEITSLPTGQGLLIK